MRFATAKKYMRRAVIGFSVRNRNKKAALIEEFMATHDVKDVVFVGCSPGTNPNESIVEAAIGRHARVLLACDVLRCTGLPWPFVQADGRALPLPDKRTDMVLANAVIEHVGTLEAQQRFVAEQSRVARAWVITTPNRWFPIESHTSAIFLHWSRSWRERPQGVHPTAVPVGVSRAPATRHDDPRAPVVCHVRRDARAERGGRARQRRLMATRGEHGRQRAETSLIQCDVILEA